MQRRLSSQATWSGSTATSPRPDGRPSGILLHDGVLVTPAERRRSSAGITLDGLLDVRKVGFCGTWRGTGQRRALTDLNKAPGTNGISLFTRDWGATTPRIPGVVSPWSSGRSRPRARTPTSSCRSLSLRPARSVAIAPGHRRARSARECGDEAPGRGAVGHGLTLRLILQPDWAVVSDAIGGGPILVRDGEPVYRQRGLHDLAARPARSANGRRPARGRGHVLRHVDGRQPGYSVGDDELRARAGMVRLGAVRAWRSTAEARRPSRSTGRCSTRPRTEGARRLERADAPVLRRLRAAAARVRPLAQRRRGGGDADSSSFKIVRPSTVTVTLTGRTATVAWQETGPRDPGTYTSRSLPLPLPPPPGQPAPPAGPLAPAEGRWTLTVNATDDQGLRRRRPDASPSTRRSASCG